MGTQLNIISEDEFNTNLGIAPRSNNAATNPVLLEGPG
jgi:hypothetical protein